MSDDGRLPVGAAAPNVERVIRSLITLDALWVGFAAVFLIAASFFEIVDLPGQQLATSDSPYRVYSVLLPAVALVLAAIGGIRQKSTTVAVATGLLAPSAAGVGVLSASIFLDRDAAYADVGVAASLAASAVCVAALIRWFVYHPVSLMDDESRPTVRLAEGLAAAAVATAAIIAYQATDDRGDTTAQFVVQLCFALIVPLAAVAAAVVRTRPAFVVAGSAALAQFVAVLAVRIDASDGDQTVDLGSAVTIWTGPVGLLGLVALAAVCAASARFHSVDEQPDAPADDESWRWTADD